MSRFRRRKEPIRCGMTVEEVMSLLLGESATGTPWVPLQHRPDNDPVLERHLDRIAWAAGEGAAELTDALAALDPGETGGSK